MKHPDLFHDMTYLLPALASFALTSGLLYLASRIGAKL